MFSFCNKPRTRAAVAASTVFGAACLMGSCAGTGSSGFDASGMPPEGLPEQGELPQPGLIVLMVVDQLRYDLLERYSDLWVGGFRRLRAEARSYTAATHDHAVTETAPGHATISTGTHPSQHGIVGNGWLEADGTGWRTVENVVDRTVPLVGNDQFAGASPERLRRFGLADWLLQASPRSQIVSIAGKDRAAVLLASRAPGYVYWYNAGVGRFVTSTHYRDSDPGWIEDFNRDRLPGFLADSVWANAVPPEHVGRAGADSVPWEGDGIHVSFPHTRATHATPPGVWLASTPTLDQATLDLARTAMEELKLGTGETLDFLALGLSQTDRVGHAYGPLSLEQLDNLLRLDLALEEFLSALEQHLQGRPLTLVLTADHGVLDAPERLREAGLPGRRLGQSEREAFAATIRAAGEEGPQRLAPRLLEGLGDLDWVDASWPLDAPPSDSLGTLERHTHFPGRFPGTLERYGVGYRMTPGTLDWGWPRGTTHGSPYHYDRHVPLFFYGTGISGDTIATRTSTTAIAPTLAEWLSIRFPADVDGAPLMGSRGAPRR